MENPHQNDSLVEHQSQSALIQSFWHGKSLQKAYKERKSSPNSLNAVNGEFDNSTRHRETSLSSNVLKLICESFKQLDAAFIPNQECIFTKAEIERLEIWQKIKSVLGEDIITVSNCNFHDVVKRLHPVCHIIHNWLLNLERHEFEEQCKENLKWTGYDDRFLTCFSLLKSSNPADHNLCFLLLTSSLEHALGDVYLSYSGAYPCPSLLKDLLATQELKDVFGDTVISLLHILIGPPSSLNLRNVLWHGFAAPGEVPIQYASLLLVIAASLSNKLKDAPFCSKKVKRRPLMKLTSCSGEQESVFLSLELPDMPEIIKLFHASFFIISSMLPLWLQALDYFFQRRFDLCVVLLLPQLEHGLRRVFACVNNCPHRALTAESTVLYTTFDEILSPVLRDGSQNLLRKEIGAGHMEMLLDVLVHPEGPRIRDHISHGEVNMGEISQESANHILCICIAFAGLYIYPDKSNHDGDCPFPVTENICGAARAYKSVFHPISQVKRILHKVALSFLKWHDLPKPVGEEFTDSLESNEKKWAEDVKHAMKACEEAMTSLSLPVDNVGKLLPIQFDLDQTNAFVYAVEQILDAGPFLTLYRPKHEMEIVLLLRSIVQHENVISEQICEAAKVKHQQWNNRQLRQRQRANYKRLWSQIPFIFSALQLVVVVVITELFQLPKSREESDRSIFIRFLKRCLQYTENMESLSSMSKNRWDECRTAGEALVKCIEHYYTKHKHEDIDL